MFQNKTTVVYDTSSALELMQEEQTAQERLSPETLAHLIYLTMALLSQKKQLPIFDKMWKYAKDQVGSVEKIFNTLQPLKTNYEASKWLLRAWLIASFAEPSDNASAYSEKMLELVHQIVINST